jgi:hypothetical protein
MDVANQLQFDAFASGFEQMKNIACQARFQQLSQWLWYSQVYCKGIPGPGDSSSMDNSTAW